MAPPPVANSSSPVLCNTKALLIAEAVATIASFLRIAEVAVSAV